MRTKNRKLSLAFEDGTPASPNTWRYFGVAAKHAQIIANFSDRSVELLENSKRIDTFTPDK